MIVFFIPDLRAGGAERVMLTLLNEFYNTDEKSSYLLLLGKKQGDLSNLIPQDIKVLELGVTSGSKMVMPFIKFCKKHKPTVVFATLGASLTTAIAKPFISNAITIINRLGNTIGAEKKLFTNSIKRYLYILANKRIAKKSDKLIFQCNYMKEDFIKETNCIPKESYVIYNPVNVERISALSKKPVFHSSFDFVAVGRLNPQKDYFTLLNACALLKNKQIAFKLAILGEGNLRDTMQDVIDKKELNKNVFLLGHQPNPYPLMKSAKFLISSSLYEGFSNVIIESLCLGTPILASDCPGGNSETIDISNGRLFPLKNQEALTQLMIDSLNKNSIFNKNELMKNARKKYQLKTIVSQYKNIII
ncbi:glycosyltransferase [Nonlabens sp.]|uniref:glycosyltransferase n=1 Tax=Nonlabens sp. TaxID=1888209 RepID=UPI003F69D437